MRILIVTDAWPPQVNGVVRTLQTVGRELGKRGHEVRYITPEGHRTWAIPSYPEIELSLVGAKTIGREDTYARAMSSADVFVFPSLTDTFGLVMIEAMACGTPVAAFNVASPIDVVESGVTGELDSDLSIAVAGALKLDRDGVRRGATKFTWERVAEMFESWLVPIDAEARRWIELGDLETQT